MFSRSILLSEAFHAVYLTRQTFSLLLMKLNFEDINLTGDVERKTLDLYPASLILNSASVLEG